MSVKWLLTEGLGGSPSYLLTLGLVPTIPVLIGSVEVTAKEVVHTEIDSRELMNISVAAKRPIRIE